MVLVLILFAVLHGTSSSFSQNIEFLPITKLQTQQGLSSPNVRKILQDKYGFMWFSTQDGLNRFDGVNFLRFTGNDKIERLSLITSDVFDIVQDKDENHLWALTAYGGLNKIDIGTASVIGKYHITSPRHNTSDYWFKCITLVDEYIFIGSNENLVLRFNKKTNRVDRMSDPPLGLGPNIHLDDIYTDTFKRIWLFYSNYGIVVTDTSFSTIYSFIPSEKLTGSGPEIEFTDKIFYDGHIYITTSRGMKIISIESFIMLPFPTVGSSPLLSYLNEPLNAICEKEGLIHLIGKPGLFRFNPVDKTIQQVIMSRNYEDREWFSLSNSVYQQSNQIWIGSQYGVAWIKNTYTPFTGIYTSMNGNGNKIQHSMTLLPIDDSILLSCSDNGIYRLNYLTSNITRFEKPEVYYSVGKINNSLFLASGRNGSVLFTAQGKSQRIADKFPELSVLESDALVDIQSIDDSLFFFSSQTQKGIYIWNKKSKTLKIINTGSKEISLKSNVVNRVFIDSKKNVWILCDDVISIFDPSVNKIEHLNLINPKNDQPLSINMDICELNNEYWIASYGTGIVKLGIDKRLGRIYDSKDGINNLGLYKIFSINDSTILASSNNGLSALRIKKERILNYFESDGLHSNNFEETSGCQYKDYLFVGGINGITRLNKARFSVDTTAPSLYFTSIQIPEKNIDTSYLFIKKFRVPSNASLVTINFTGLYNIAPEKLKFEYRIIPKSENWITINSSRSIPIISLLPGTYTVQLRASNEDGVWSEPIELELIFLPKWYQTWWFKLSLVLLAISAVYGLYRIRINQLKKEQQIRSKLASDLHDDLGSTMNSVKVYTNLAIMEKQPDKYLLKIKESTQEAITGIKDIIWVLDDSKDSIEHLLSRISLFAAPLCEANNIQYKQEITDEARYHKLGQEERRNLYMMLKEAVNNAIKYSGAQNLIITASVKKKKTEIHVKDDGNGFNTSKTYEGNGLKNMRRRAKEIKYHILIESAPNNGVAIHFQKI